MLYPPSKPNILVLLSLLLLLRSRAITGPRDLVRALSRVRLSKHSSPSELAKALQQLYVEEPDGTRNLLVPFRNSISKVRPIIPFAPCVRVLHGPAARSQYIPFQTHSSYHTSTIFLSSHHPHRTSPMSIEIFSASSWLSCASLSLHIVHPKSASSLSIVPSLFCVPSLVSALPS
jgi:hypothetical protein